MSATSGDTPPTKCTPSGRTQASRRRSSKTARRGGASTGTGPTADSLAAAFTAALHDAVQDRELRDALQQSMQKLTASPPSATSGSGKYEESGKEACKIAIIMYSRLLEGLTQRKNLQHCTHCMHGTATLQVGSPKPQLT